MAVLCALGQALGAQNTKYIDQYIIFFSHHCSPLNNFTIEKGLLNPLLDSFPVLSAHLHVGIMQCAALSNTSLVKCNDAHHSMLLVPYHAIVHRGCQTCIVCNAAAGGIVVAGDTVLGNSTSGTLTVNSPTYLKAPVQVQTQLTMGDSSTLNVSGNAVLGSDSTDIITVNGVTTFKSAVAFQGPVVFPNGASAPASNITMLGNSSQDLLTVSGLATFAAAVRANTELYVNSLLTVRGSTILGNSSSDQLIVNAAATFVGPTVYRSSSLTPANSSVVQLSRSLGSGPVSAGTVLGRVLFTGFDGAIDAAAAQISSVYTVSF